MYCETQQRWNGKPKVSIFFSDKIAADHLDSIFQAVCKRPGAATKLKSASTLGHERINETVEIYPKSRAVMFICKEQ